jgi:hypothetical protein
MQALVVSTNEPAAVLVLVGAKVALPEAAVVERVASRRWRRSVKVAGALNRQLHAGNPRGVASTLNSINDRRDLAPKCSAT